MSLLLFIAAILFHTYLPQLLSKGTFLALMDLSTSSCRSQGKAAIPGMQRSGSAQSITWDEQHRMSLMAQVQHTHTSELPTWAGEGGEEKRWGKDFKG